MSGFRPLYIGLIGGAIAVAAGFMLSTSETVETVAQPTQSDIAAAAATPLEENSSMKKLTWHEEPRAISDKPFIKVDGSEGTLADYQGKHIVLNFWATWCAPCRHEMPMLAELQSDLGSDEFEVVTLATGRNPSPAIDQFFDEIGVTNLSKHRDPTQAIGREMAVLGLPITVIIDPQGNEIARLRGDADWSSPDAKAILRNLLGQTS